MARVKRAAGRCHGLVLGLSMGAGMGVAMADDVHLGKPRSAADPSRWEGRVLGEVIDVDAIARVILLRAVTSAPATLDLENVCRALADSVGATLQAPPAARRHDLGLQEVIWHAVLLDRSGKAYDLKIGCDDDRRRIACLVDEAGHRGCFAPADRPSS